MGHFHANGNPDFGIKEKIWIPASAGMTKGDQNPSPPPFAKGRCDDPPFREVAIGYSPFDKGG
jgi:hypothetical protein